MKITPDHIMALPPCEDWTRAMVVDLIGDGIEARDAIPVLMRLSSADARWLMSRLLPRPLRIEWACLCASRALRYTGSRRALALASIRAARAAARDDTPANREVTREAADAAHVAVADHYAAYAAYYTAYAAYYTADSAYYAAYAAYYAYYAAYAASAYAASAEHKWQMRCALMLLQRGERGVADEG